MAEEKLFDPKYHRNDYNDFYNDFKSLEYEFIMSISGRELSLEEFITFKHDDGRNEAM